MKIRMTDHALQRIEKYGLSESLIREGIKNPDSIIEGHSNRKIAQKKLNGYVLRIVFEKEKDINIIVTVYKAKVERYGI